MKTILSIILCLPICFAQAQTQPKSVQDTVINKVTYKLYVGVRGGKYILVTSKNGIVYKKYLKSK